MKLKPLPLATCPCGQPLMATKPVCTAHWFSAPQSIRHAWDVGSKSDRRFLATLSFPTFVDAQIKKAASAK